MANRICCPTCMKNLEIDGSVGERHCPACGHRYTIQNGIIDFTPEDRFYWGEISREEMLQVNTQAERIGWHRAYLESVNEKTSRDFYGYMFSPNRIAGMFHYYHPQRSEACLDLGSGWGPISFGLSKYYETVYSMDGVLERLQFQAIRAAQDGVDNITILKGSMLSQPFCPNSMDTVIANGVLEWIGLSDEVTHPQVLQEQFLSEAYRVLKPGGKLFIGIENRLGAQLFMGAIDHSGLRFTSLMPRWLASIAVRMQKKAKAASVFSGADTSYRTYTYSSWGYRRMLAKVGFNQTDVYWTRPSYNNPAVSGSLDARSIKHFIQTTAGQMEGNVPPILLRIIERSPDRLVDWMVKAFSPYFLIVASKGAAEQTVQEAALGDQPQASFLRTTIYADGILQSSYALLDSTEVKSVSVNPGKAEDQPKGRVWESVQ